MELKPFQHHTVEEILLRLSQHPVYALADETGLGKTVVCGEVAYRLVANSQKKSYVIFYVAPSIELLDQNLDSLKKHLDSHLDASRFQVHRLISRVTQLPLALAHQKVNRDDVFVIGLSPDTSFKISTRGTIDERAYLAALFGMYQRKSTKYTIMRAFWCLEREMDCRFIERVHYYSNKERLGVLFQWRHDCSSQYLEFSERIETLSEDGTDILKKRRRLVLDIRRAIAAYLIKAPQSLPDLVIFDEWHKYKATCFDSNKKAEHDRLVADMLAALRKQQQPSQTSKVLFVSATPFTVNYDEIRNESEAITSGDLKSLIELFWDKNRFQHEYQGLLEKQHAFIRTIERLLRHSTNQDIEALQLQAMQCQRDYEDELRRYCVRTERPRPPYRDANRGGIDAWGEIFRLGSAKQFLRQFGEINGVRSPVAEMWMDGHDFPSANYDGLRKFGLKNIKGMHWKVRQLQSLLKIAFEFDDRLHSLDRPPLWLWPERKLRGRKQLIFSEFRFVPEEICSALKQHHSHIGSTSSYSGSVLGIFPMALRHSVDRAKSSSKADFHFVLFYPFLFWELEPTELQKRVKSRRNELEEVIKNGEYVVPTLLEVEALLMRGSPHINSLNEREMLMDRDAGIVCDRGFRMYLRAILDGNIGGGAPGWAVARVSAALRSSIVEDSPRLFESHALNLGRALLHLFVSPEAQYLKKHAEELGILRANKKTSGVNSLARFVLWYAKRYRLHDTLQEFAAVLVAGGESGSRTLSTMTSTLSLGRGRVGTKFFRSFHDRQLDEDVTGDEHATVSPLSLRAAFNSPFAPYVLASTSVGQEGLDFHRYCDAIIHWNPPSSPSVLRQREGRLDRFRSLQVRIAKQNLPETCQALNDIEYDGLSPDFVVMHNGQRVNQTHSKVFYLPFTSQQARWKRCLQRMHYDDLLIGAPDPLADEQMWLSAVDAWSEEEREQRFKLLSAFSISLRPKKRTT